MSTRLVDLSVGPDVFVASGVTRLQSGNSLRSALWSDSCPGLKPAWIVSVPST